MKQFRTFLRFSRVHTIVGTSLSITALYVLAWSLSGRANLDWGLWVWSLLSCLGANVYIVGLNQITDIDIDRINKPYLPLASGEYSLRTGYVIVTFSVLLSLLIASLNGPFLLLTVVLSLLLGTAYSLPPLRLKRFYFWAAFCIIAVRGLIVNLLLFLHFQYELNGLVTIPAVVWLLTGTIFIYSIAIAWFKDIPDMEGDDRFEIHTLSLRLGARRVFNLGNGLLIGLLFLLMALALWLPMQVSGIILLLSHAAILGVFWWRKSQVQLGQQTSVARYYQFVWGLFFVEYISFAVAGVWG